MLEHCDGVAIVAVQAILRAKPHEAPCILHNCVDCGLRKALLECEMAKLYINSLRENTIRTQRCWQKESRKKSQRLGGVHTRT